LKDDTPDFLKRKNSEVFIERGRSPAARVIPETARAADVVLRNSGSACGHEFLRSTQSCISRNSAAGGQVLQGRFRGASTKTSLEAFALDSTK
jgi:hypothetical protein